MKLYPISHGDFKLDGGAMFGVVPKVIWQRTNPADENNLIEMTTRSLLIEDGDQLILIDTGMGNKQSDKFFSYYKPSKQNMFDETLKKYGFHRDDITDVFLTHLHFDHSGGAIVRNDKGFYEPAFKNAKFWSNAKHWDWAVHPNAREKASFLSENILPIEESGQLNFIDTPTDGRQTTHKDLNMDILFVDGHTEKQMLPMIEYQGHKIIYMADLLPTVGHIPLPYIMGYDTRPLLTLDERQDIFSKAAAEKWLIFLEHDAYNELCTLKQTEKGVRLDKIYKFDEIFNS
ncbi:MAG TPA: MBL fold metallo-hydrolase [Flavobacteriales bacterium]|jgi:glyoxylase-like metal-dependent hydrolase (beta-lactamase superfamily II)|nr:MBL fold metallo-hydrolase [Flavobacteriales bacterium]